MTQKNIFILVVIGLILGSGALFVGYKKTPTTPSEGVLPKIVTEKDEATSTDDTILVVTGEWDPFTSEKLPDQGFFTAIVAATFKEMGKPYTIKFYPWPRGEALVLSGEAFATFPYFVTDDRKKIYSFSDPVFNTYTKFFYYKRDKTDFTYHTMEDLKHYKIAGIAGYYYLEWFKKAGVAFDYSDNEDIALEKLVAGRVDLVPFTYENGLQVIAHNYPNEIANFGVLNKPLNTDPVQLMVSKDYPHSREILDEWNAAFARIVAKGIYGEILKKYHEEGGSILTPIPK